MSVTTVDKKEDEYKKVSTDEAVFANFHNLLMRAAPKDYIPYYFRCAANSKEPYTKVGSWLKNPLSFEEACDWLRKGNNVGIAGLDEDPLVIIDIDDENVTDYKTLKTTLTARSASRKGVHLFYFEDVPGSIPNIPTDDAGEIRANNQYVIAAGSYATGYSDKVENIGQYTIEVAKPAEKINLSEVPEVFKDQLKKNKEDEKKINAVKQKREGKGKGDGKRSALFDLTVYDVVSYIPNPNERFPSLFHDSKTGKNTSINNGLIHCFRHMVTLNALQTLCVLSGYLTCQEAGSPKKGSNAGPSLVIGDDQAIWEAWKYAKENSLIPKDDPIPLRALAYVAYSESFCKKEDIKDEWKIPIGAYNQALARLKKKKIEPGREEHQKKQKEEDNILAKIENAIEDSKKPKYHGTINFNPDLGIFFTVPWEIPPRVIKDEKGKIEKVYTPQCKPVLHNLREGFAQPTDKDKVSRIKKCLLTQPQQTIELISQFSEAIEGVPLYLSQNQRVQILEAYLTLIKTGKSTCKQISEDLVTHLCTKHISYFKFEKDIEHYVVGCWAIGTYLFPMFPVFPYLIFIGEKGTNKSGNLTFLDRVCWNPTSKLSLPNEAPLFRLMDHARPTQLIDEVHRQLNDPIRGPVLKALLETGHEKGGRVPRCNENDNNKIDFYDVYCPKVLASRESLELEEKAITIITTKVQDKSYAIARKNLETDPELESIRAGLFNFALTNWEKIYNTYQEIEPTPKLSGRYFLLWAPILAICEAAYPDKYEDMVEYAEKVIIGVQKKSYEIELIVLSWLVARLTDIKNNGNAILLKDITDALNLKWQPTYSALRNLGVIKLDRDTKNGKKYYLRVDRIEKLGEERGITIEDEGEEYDKRSEEEIEEAIKNLTADEIKKLKKLEKEIVGECDICKSHLKPLVYGVIAEHGDIKKAFCDECMEKITDDEVEKDVEAKERKRIQKLNEETKEERQPKKQKPVIELNVKDDRKRINKIIGDNGTDKRKPVEITPDIADEKGQCQICGYGEKWGIELPYLVFYSETDKSDFKTVCKRCGKRIMKDYNLKLIGGDKQ